MFGSVDTRTVQFCNFVRAWQSQTKSENTLNISDNLTCLHTPRTMVVGDLWCSTRIWSGIAQQLVAELERDCKSFYYHDYLLPHDQKYSFVSESRKWTLVLEALAWLYGSWEMRNFATFAGSRRSLLSPAHHR